MVKVKKIRTADCVVGGFRYASKGKAVGSLLLGLYEKGLLHHVGSVRHLARWSVKSCGRNWRSSLKPPGFTGRAPGAPVDGPPSEAPSGSRWAPSSLSKSNTTISPASDSATAPLHPLAARQVSPQMHDETGAAGIGRLPRPGLGDKSCEGFAAILEVGDLIVSTLDDTTLPARNGSGFFSCLLADCRSR